MIRGTTPTQTFSLPEGVEATSLAKLVVTYKQGNTIKLEKHKDDGTITDNKFSVPLTQQDTLALEEGEVQVQLKAKTAGGQVLVGQIINLPVKPVLNEEVQ